MSRFANLRSSAAPFDQPAQQSSRGWRPHRFALGERRMEVDEVTREFAEAFSPGGRGPCKLYLISPQEVAGAFRDRLKAALEPGVAAAFQLRVKDIDEHELA